MTEQLYITLLSISGTIILLLLATLGYFAKQNITVLKNVSEALQQFSVDYSATKERVTNLQDNCRDRHKVIDHRLNKHGERLDKAENKIGILEVQIK